MTAIESLSLLATIAIAALLCACIVWAIKPLLLNYALARPNTRSSHRIPTPQGGGIAVIAATLSVAAACTGLMNFTIPPVVFAATLFIALVGFADDIKSIPVLPRLLLQAAAVGAIVFTAPSDLRIVPAIPIEIERALLLFGGLWFVNLVNFMDGLDLMTVAEMVPATGTMILLGFFGEFPASATIVAGALCGAMIGFVPFNRPVAKIFLGDVGSLPIGLLFGWCLLQLAWHQQLIAALLLSSYYLADATITLVCRIARREPFWIAHRNHFYQRATDNGFTVSRVVGDVLTLNIILAALAIVSVRANSTLVSSLVAPIGAAAVAFLLYRFSRKRPTPQWPNPH
jgi:UDP-N-acetylmuramyl pentapeptide phosphotransferase/UDP-N-acetylglucosamine-1-phosphate transferase